MRLPLSKTKLRNLGRQFKMWMPTMPITLISAKSKTPHHTAYATFRVLPKMTKHEIREYLTKIYNLPVRKVNTMNYDGKRKRVMSRGGIAYYKYKDFKKAVVYFHESFTDVGLGTRLQDLDDFNAQRKEEEEQAAAGGSDAASSTKQIGS